MYPKHFLIGIISFLTVAVYGQNLPARPDRLVNDYTNTLSAAEISALEGKLVAFDDSTSTQIAVVLIQSLDGNDISDYGTKLAHSWGIGQKGRDNGVLVLASLGDRKVTIQTGYGVEGALPDAIAKRIIENEIKPYFRQGNYYQGLDNATDAIIAYTKGEYKAERKQPAQRGGNGAFLIIIIIIIIIIISKRGGRGGGQVIGGRGAASPFWWLLMGSGMGRNRGGGWGGFSGGGGFGGGGGGGFGGFGGGGFGGGGSSGSW
jgi:uncharacterized protein